MLAPLLWAALFATPSWAQSQFIRGQKWQIVLTGVPDVSKSPLPPTDAPVWDIDLFDSDAATIAALKAAGKIVICYFSAGGIFSNVDIEVFLVIDLQQFRDCGRLASRCKRLPFWRCRKSTPRMAERKMDTNRKHKGQRHNGVAHQASRR